MWCRAAFKAGGKREWKNNTHTYTHTQGRGRKGGRREREGEERKKRGGVWRGVEGNEAGRNRVIDDARKMRK